MRDLSKHMKTKWVLVGLVVAAGIATASTAIGRGRPTANASNPAADVLSRIASSRLTAATVAGGTASVEARASERGADSSRSLILDQVKYGVAVRMAVLYLATGGSMGENRS